MRHLSVTLASLALASACVASETGRTDRDPPTTRSDAAVADSGSNRAASTDSGPRPLPLVPRPEVVRGFEPPQARWLPGHRGVDLAGSPGQPVLSATAGTITYAGQLAGRGVIVVSHGQRIFHWAEGDGDREG